MIEPFDYSRLIHDDYYHIGVMDYNSSKEVWKLNFRLYGHMDKPHSQQEAQTWRRSAWRKSEKRSCGCTKEKVAKSRSTVFFQCFVAPEA